MVWLPIDEKSLFFNVVDDNPSPRPATVASTVFQGGKFDRNLEPVSAFPRMIPDDTFESVAGELLASSRISARILNVLVFDSIRVNGESVPTDVSFGMYLREEAEPERPQHGRIKLHYPLSFAFEDNSVNIDNRQVLFAVSRELNDYAFHVTAFRCDVDSRTLDFDVTILGPRNIAYSLAFNETQDSVYMSSETADEYNREIVMIRKQFGWNNVTPRNIEKYLAKWRQIAQKECRRALMESGATNIHHFSFGRPFALYDFDFFRDGRKRYAVVAFTGDVQKRFSLPLSRIQFLKAFRNVAELFLVTSVGNNPHVVVFDAERLDASTKSVLSLEYRED
jgi:hypothetical protein